MSVLLTYKVGIGQTGTGQKILDNIELFKFDLIKEDKEESSHFFKFHSSRQHGELFIKIREGKVKEVRLHVNGWGKDLLSYDDNTLIRAAEKVLEQQREKDEAKRLYDEIEGYSFDVELIPDEEIENLYVFTVTINGLHGRIVWDNRDQQGKYIIEGELRATKTLQDVRVKNKRYWSEIESKIQSVLKSQNQNIQ